MRGFARGFGMPLVVTLKENWNIEWDCNRKFCMLQNASSPYAK